MADDKATEALFGKLCLETPLYTWTDFSDPNYLYYLFTERPQFDSFCIQCEKPSAFRAMVTLAAQNNLSANNAAFPGNVSFFIANMCCVRDPAHHYRYFFKKIGKKLMKVGQYPSQETIAASDIEKFRPVMDKVTFAELKKAGGLASHGVNIGGFVYLRRIFERLIQNHRIAYEAECGELADFERLRMEEKISALKEVLPPIVVEYRQAYGILSKGIHELDEGTCGTFFPIVRAAIIAILEQDLQEKAKADAQKALKDEMAKIVGELRS